jgi:hypothetical protein
MNIQNGDDYVVIIVPVRLIESLIKIAISAIATALAGVQLLS